MTFPLPALLVAIAAASAVAGAAPAATLTFDGPICGGAACSDGSAIDQTTGDMPGLDVVYDADLGTPELEPFFAWGPSYSDLTDIAYGRAGVTAGLRFLPTAGGRAEVTGFSLGAWPFTTRGTQWSVIDLFDGAILAQSGPIEVDGTVSTRVTGLWSSASGIQLQFGPDAFNVGIDDVDYALRPGDGTVPAIPLPAALPLLLAGLGALGLMRRRG